MRKVFFLVLITTFLYSCNKEEHITPIRKSMTESIYSSIVVQPDSLYQVYAVISGILEKNFIEEGDLVLKNQPLFQVINTAP